MAAATAKYYFRFRICWCHCLQKAKVYQQTKFRRDISFGGWDITTSGFEIQTSAILECYFWFRYRPVRRNLHVILHEATEFRPNQSTHYDNMTSYLFLKMAAATTKYYFRFRICWCHCLQKVKVYQQTKFRRDISIVSFCIRLPNFVQIGTSASEIWRHIHFSRWRPRPLITTSGFVLVDVTASRRSKSISKPNFVEISQLAAKI